MTNLDKLIEDVETGNRPWREPGDTDMTCAGLILAAFDGSLDDAKSLHEAVLPNHAWDIWRGIGADCVRYYGCNLPGVDTAFAADPARAWLIAILKAYRDMQND